MTGVPNLITLVIYLSQWNSRTLDFYTCAQWHRVLKFEYHFLLDRVLNWTTFSLIGFFE